MADPALARLTVKAHGPEWWKDSTVEIDGKPISCLKVTVEIDPNENVCRATVVMDEFDLDVSGLPERVFETALYDEAASNG